MTPIMFIFKTEHGKMISHYSCLLTNHLVANFMKIGKQVKLAKPVGWAPGQLGVQILAHLRVGGGQLYLFFGVRIEVFNIVF